MCTSCLKVVLGCQPSFCFTFVGSPISRSTSAGRVKTGSATTYGSHSSPSAPNAAAQSSFDLKSPDKRIEVRIRTAHGIRYDVVLNGRAILEDSSLAINVDHKEFGKDSVKVLHATDLNGMTNAEVSAHMELSKHAGLLDQQMDYGERQRQRIRRLFSKPKG